MGWHRGPRTRSAVADAGQAAVEFAIGLPMTLIAIAAIVQVAVVVRDQLAVELAAREAARSASVTVDATAAQRRGATVSGTPGVQIQIVENDGIVTATATRSATALPIVGVAVSSVVLSASVSMLIEPP